MLFYSDWYPPEVKPVRDGWYIMESSVSTRKYMCEFKEGSWFYSDGTSIKPPYLGPWHGLSFDATWVVANPTLMPTDVLHTSNSCRGPIKIISFATEVAEKS